MRLFGTAYVNRVGVCWRHIELAEPMHGSYSTSAVEIMIAFWKTVAMEEELVSFEVMIVYGRI